MIYSKSEFAKLCGMRTSNLTNYVKRGKVVLNGNDEVDDGLEINRDFLSRHQSKQEIKQPDPPQETRLRMIRPDPGAEDLPETDDLEDEEQDEVDEKASGYALSKKKLLVDIEEKKRKIALLKLREEKIRGEVVPVDIITNVFRAHTQSIVTAQKDGIEELLINLSVEARLKGEQLARLRGKMVDILNKAVDKAAYTSQKNLKTILGQLSMKREVGEHG